MKNKLVTAAQAAELVKTGDTVAIAAFAGGVSFPEEICITLEQRFVEKNQPQDLTLVFGSGVGDSGKSDFALNHFGHEHMVSRVVAGHVGLSSKLSALIAENKIAAYNLPQGVLVHILRAAAGGHPGIITHVGLHTFADPRVEGGRMNTAAKEDLCEVVTIGGKEQLFYKALPIDVALIRATTADEFGNLTMEKEATLVEALEAAQAAHNNGGIVIAQVERIAAKGSLNPKDVRVPGILVDYIVKARPENHRMNALVDYNPAFSGELRVPQSQIEPMKHSARKIIAKRCAQELKPDTIINLGIGVPEGVAAIALEEGISDEVFMTVESGVIGGSPASGLHIGASTNPEAIITHPAIFDFYDGGGLDTAFLGLAQVDKEGNVNVSRFSGRMVGCGGFVNITQNAKTVVFCGTFCAGKDNRGKKFVQNVEQITFSGKYADAIGQKVLYVTERAVFKLSEGTLELIEIAPGADLQQDILDFMDFQPRISPALKIMRPEIFSDELLGLKEEFAKVEEMK